MHRQLRFGLIFLAILVAQISNAQEKWTLESCIQYAIDNNIQIKQQSLYTEIQENQLQSTKLSALPSLNASAYESLRFGRNVDPYTNDFTEDNTQSFNMDVSAQMDLFRGGQRFHEIKKSQLNLEAGLKDLEKAKNDLSVNIANAFFNVLFNEELLEVSIKQLETTQEQLTNTEKLVNAGALAQGNLLEVQSQLANEQLQVINAENNLDLAYLTLVQFLELDSVKGFKIERPILDPIKESIILPPVKQVYLEAEMIMPEIERSELDVAIANRDLALSRSNFYPSLVLSASYGSGYSSARKDIDEIIPTNPMLIGYGVNSTTGDMFDVYQYGFDYTYKDRPFSDQIKDNASASLSLGLSIPIFNGWQVRSAVDNSKINYDISKYSLELTKKNLLREIQQAYADASAAQKKYIATEKALDAMQESFRYTQKRFDIGMVTSLEYNTAKNQLNQTESELLRAKYEFIFKQKILDFYRGIPISISQ
jgi:outer membrane protein